MSNKYICPEPGGGRSATYLSAKRLVTGGGIVGDYMDCVGILVFLTPQHILFRECSSRKKKGNPTASAAASPEGHTKALIKDQNSPQTRPWGQQFPAAL